MDIISDWTFSNLVQYYDANTDVVTESARRLSALDAAGKDQALAQVAAAVRAHAERLRSAGQDMAQAAVSVTDDLYKTLARAQGWSPQATRYLRPRELAGAQTGVHHLTALLRAIEVVIIDTWFERRPPKTAV